MGFQRPSQMWRRSQVGIQADALLIYGEQQLKILMNTKKVSLSLLKGHPSIQSSAFPSTFPESSDLRFCLNRFGRQTVICPSNLTSEKAARFPCDLRRFLDNQWVSDAGWKFLAQVNAQNISRAPCGRLGLVNTTQGLHLHRKCGNRTNAKLPWTMWRPTAVCQGGMGIFWKITLHHIEQIRPHASLWEKADNICLHINTLKIFSRHIGVEIAPLSRSSWQSKWRSGCQLHWLHVKIKEVIELGPPNWICLICINFEHPV